MKKISIVPSILIVLSLMMLIPTFVFAWFSFQHSISLVTLDSDYLSVDVNINESDYITVSNNLITSSTLTYIDFNKDIVLNTSGALNMIATPIAITIENSNSGVAVRNKVDVSSFDGQSLVYVIIIEGVNVVDPQSYETDYHGYLSVLIGSESTETGQRGAINIHNQNMLQYIETVSLQQTETITFQIVVWADYDLYSGQNYLDDVYNLSLVIDTVQADGDF